MPTKESQIVRRVLFCYNNDLPIKKKYLQNEIGHDKDEFKELLNQSRYIMKDKMGLDLLKLNQVPLSGDKMSAKRDEYLVVSLVKEHRYHIFPFTNEEINFKWGVLLFIVALSVLLQDGVKFTQFMHAYEKIGGSVDNERLHLSRIITSLADQRFLEVIKSGEERDDTYVIGPATKCIVNRNSVYKLVLHLAFPKEDLNSHEFKEKNVLILADLEKKIQMTCLDE